MIWVILKDESHQIISSNIFTEGNKHQVWVTRPNAKNLKVFEDKDIEEALLLKEALDFAIKTGEKTFTIS